MFRDQCKCLTPGFAGMNHGRLANHPRGFKVVDEALLLPAPGVTGVVVIEPGLANRHYGVFAGQRHQFSRRRRGLGRFLQWVNADGDMNIPMLAGKGNKIAGGFEIHANGKEFANAASAGIGEHLAQVHLATKEIQSVQVTVGINQHGLRA